MLPLPKLVLYFTAIPLMLLLGVGFLGYFQMQKSARELELLLDSHRPVLLQINQAERYLRLAQSLFQENLLSPPIPADLTVATILQPPILQPTMYGKEIVNYLKHARDNFENLQKQELSLPLGIASEINQLKIQTNHLLQDSLKFYKEHNNSDLQANTIQITKSKLLPSLNSLFQQLNQIRQPLVEQVSALEKEILRQLELRSVSLITTISLTIFLTMITGLSLLALVRRRGELMIRASNALAEGDFGHRIHMPSSDFMQRMAESFNSMAKILQHNDNDIRNYTQELDNAKQQLEIRVKERTSELEESQRQLTRMAFYDSLTGLPNRVLFYERLQQQLQLDQRHNQKSGIMFIDLDKFKLINDNYGHDIGDKLLQVAAQRISDCFTRKCDTVARIGGDEFTVLLPDIKDTHDCTVMAENILSRFRLPIHIDELTLKTSPSIGIAFAPDSGCNVNSLMKNADTAMYRAKLNGKNQYCLFDSVMSQENREEMELRDALHDATKNQEIELYYQPKIDANSGHIHSFEALVRWNHPTLGIVSPDQFIPIAEETGYILALGEWVLHQACHQIKSWQQKYDLKIGVAINLSPEQLKDSSLESKVRSALSKSKLSPQYLELEITENSAIFDLKNTSTTLDKLRNIGITVTLDDFGSSYASLRYLKQLPIDTIKVDRSFIEQLTEDPWDQAIVTAVSILSKKLNLKLVAEGVENRGHIDLLTELGFDLFQGYFFSKPLPVKEATKLIAHYNASRKASSKPESIEHLFPEAGFYVPAIDEAQ